MPSAREDYLLRLIQQMAAVVARLRERLMGPSAGIEAADIEREAGAAITTLLGLQATILQQLDPASGVRLVADRERVALWIALMRVQAEALRASGRVDAADRLTVRADVMERAAGLAQS
jgi:hypothetical protein